VRPAATASIDAFDDTDQRTSDGHGEDYSSNAAER
jgi:hypothetical protein